MNILDEDVPLDQRQALRRWRIRARQIGYDVGRKGIKDQEIIDAPDDVPPSRPGSA